MVVVPRQNKEKMMSNEYACKLEIDDQERYRFIVFEKDYETYPLNPEPLYLIHDICVFEAEQDMRNFVDEYWLIHGELNVNCDYLPCKRRD